MLSNQSFNLHQRHNSTPGVNDVALKATFLPANQHSLDGTHRQGLNLDQRANPQQPHQHSMQDNGNTNHGLYQQQNLREAQQHPQARPGQYQQQINQAEHNNTFKQQSSTTMSHPTNQAGFFEYDGADFSALLGSANTSLYGFNQVVPPERPCTPPNQTLKSKHWKPIFGGYILTQALRLSSYTYYHTVRTAIIHPTRHSQSYSTVFSDSPTPKRHDEDSERNANEERFVLSERVRRHEAWKSRHTITSQHCSVVLLQSF